MTKEEVCARIREIGIIPAIRVSSTEDAHFAIEAVASGGIPIVEITMTVPGAVELISHLVRASHEDHRRRRHGPQNRHRSPVQGRRRAIHYGAWIQSGDRGICRQGGSGGFARRINADRSRGRMDGRR